MVLTIYLLYFSLDLLIIINEKSDPKGILARCFNLFRRNLFTIIQVLFSLKIHDNSNYMKNLFNDISIQKVRVLYYTANAKMIIQAIEKVIFGARDTVMSDIFK